MRIVLAPGTSTGKEVVDVLTRDDSAPAKLDGSKTARPELAVDRVPGYAESLGSVGD